MNKSANLIMALGLCLFCMTSAQAQRLLDPNQPQDSGVQMILTHLSVTDQTLELGLKITNNTDHDVWVCNGYNGDDGIRYFDRFMATDDKTLVLRRRYNLPSAALVEGFPSPFRYLRLRPGQEKVESHSFSLPVTSTSPVFHTSAGGINAKSAQRLAIEIGFYDEDLRALILGVVDMAERIGYDDSAISAVMWSGPLSLYYRFFGGFEIAGWFKNRAWFRDSVTSDGDEILSPPMHQALNGEQVLRTEVDNVSIPYKNFYYSQQVQPRAPTDVTMALTRLDVNNTNLELGLKITNNTNHDVWVCNGYEPVSSSSYFERWMATDDKTLVLRRRYNLSSQGVPVERGPNSYRYLRLRPGQEKVESHSFTLPVTSTSPLFQTSGSGGLNVNSAQRLVIEIGFYDEDLRALILDVVDMAERIGRDDSTFSELTEPANTVGLYYRFFGGFNIAGWFKNRTWFRDSVTSDGDDILIPPLRQSLNGEQILRIEVENLSIPFRIL